MGRLAGFRAADVIRKLRKAGFELERRASSSHEIWRNPTTRCKIVVPHHSREIAEGTMRAIVREAGMTVDEFLEL